MSDKPKFTAFIKASDFVRRQTPESPYSHFEGTWEELEKLCATNVRLGLTRAGYRDGVVLVDIEPDQFMTSVVSLKEGFANGTITRLKAVYEARQEGEEPVVKVTAYGKKQRAKKAVVVLYRWDVLEEGNERSQDSEWEIISVNASPTEEETPMGATARARNILVETGGTDPELEKKSKEELIEFIRDGAAASMFWSRHTMVQPESEYVDEELERYKQWVDDLQSGMYINCVYCGHRYGPDDEVPASMADVLKEHVANCPKHPMSQLKKALEPFAKMHREGGNPTEIACTRGTGHEATHIFSRDFEAAAKALEGTWDMAGKLEGRINGIAEFAKEHCGYTGFEGNGPEGVLYEYVEKLESEIEFLKDANRRANEMIGANSEELGGIVEKLAAENRVLNGLLEPQHFQEVERLKNRLQEIAEFARDSDVASTVACGVMAEKELKNDEWRFKAPGRLMMTSAALLSIAGGDVNNLTHAKSVAKEALKMAEYWDWENEFESSDDTGVHCGCCGKWLPDEPV
jgi:hypothetical protein